MNVGFDGYIKARNGVYQAKAATILRIQKLPMLAMIEWTQS